jgi:outer membrane receptor protein involved in Fe transport
MPTAKAHYSFDIDHDSYGGTSTNVSATGTIDRGRLGYALAYGIDGTPGPLNNYRVPGAATEVAGGSSATINGVPYCGKASLGTSCFQSAGAGPTNVVGLPTFGVGLYACCDALSSQYLARTELAKLRYAFSDQTSLSVAYLGAQSSAAYAQTFAYPGITFTPPAGYAGSIAAHTAIPLAFDTYSPYTLATTQGLLESELRTSVGNDSLLFRYYTGANNSNDYNVAFGGAYTVSTHVWGGLPNAAGGATYYNDTPATISVTGAGTSQPAQDHFDGISGEFDIPAGNNLYTLSLDRTRHNSYAASLYDLSSQDTTQIPSGSSQAFTTASLRALLALSPKINLNVANYFIDYKTHYTADGGATWSDSASAFYAPRLALTYRVTPRSVARLSLGSSIAPPYLALVTTQGGAPQPNVEGDPSYYTETKNTGKISPESAFGYDLGFDQRVAHDTAVSGDVYLTQLHGQFLTSTTAQGTYTGTSGVNAGFTAPLFVQEAQNLGSSRYDGIELSIHRTPLLGFGYRVQGSLMRAYAYALPAGFYDTANGKNTTNLGVIPNINFQPTGLTFNGISNGRIPYATGYAELNYRKKRAFYLVGATYYGSNNAFNEPAFAVVNATARYDIAQHTSFQVSANNVTSAYSTAWGSLQGGIPAPLVNGLFGALPGVTVGPSNFHFVLRHDFGN